MISVGDIIALTGFTLELLKYANSVRQASGEWKALEEEVANSTNILIGLNRQLPSPDFQGHGSQQLIQSLSTTGGPLAQLRSALNKIRAGLEKPDTKGKHVLKALKWPYKKSEVHELRLQIHRAKEDILVILSQVTIHQNSQSLQHTSRIDLEDILQKISPLDFFGHQRFSRNKALPGTVRWFLDGPSFQGWAEGRAPVLLWCHGIAGAGKTVLASTAFEELRAKHTGPALQF